MAGHLKNQPEFKDVCETKGPADCCPDWSLGGYIAILHNRTSWFTILEEDVTSSVRLLQSCVGYYNDGHLTRGCMSCMCQEVPQDCKIHNAVCNILRFLTDDRSSVQNN